MKITTCHQLFCALLFVAVNATGGPAASAYHELRIYTVTSNKMDGVVERFRDTVEPVRHQHGKTVDNIVALPLTLDTTAKFDFTSANPACAFDLRSYSVLPGKLEAFRNRWRDFAVPIYERHGLHSAGWWVAEKKDADGNDQFVCLLAGESIPAILKSIGEFHQDADWVRVEKVDGKVLITRKGSNERLSGTFVKLNSDLP